MFYNKSKHKYNSNIYREKKSIIYSSKTQRICAKTKINLPKFVSDQHGPCKLPPKDDCNNVSLSLSGLVLLANL